MPIKRKYVDSHWLIFAFEGLVAILFGWFALFNNVTGANALIAIVGSTLLGLGIVELFNMLRRAVLKETWGFSLVSALLEIATAFALLFTSNQHYGWHLMLIAGYTIVRGVLEIMIGLKSVDDKTDKFIWILLGICGAIMGFVILNSASLGDSMFVKFFGTYMLIYGVGNMIYGVHNRDQAKYLAEEKAYHRELVKNAKASVAAPKKATKQTKSTAKTTKKPTTSKKTVKKSSRK